MFFVGVDLAWSTRNGSGVAVLKGDQKKAELVFSAVAFSDDDIIKLVNQHVKKQNAFVAIDAPLIVPNEEGRRDAEALTGMLFRKYDAGAHPSNRKRLSQWTGTIRGEEISKRLTDEGFEHSPYIDKFEKKRKFFEVFPHPSIVVLFKLDRILRYKAKPKRDYEFRWKEFEKYQKHLKTLEKADPALILPKEITRKNVRKLRAKALKDFEDVLDSVLCAYIAYYCWAHPEAYAVLGDMQKGYIMTPIFEHMKKQLEDEKNQKHLGDF